MMMETFLEGLTKKKGSVKVILKDKRGGWKRKDQNDKKILKSGSTRKRKMIEHKNAGVVSLHSKIS